LGEIVREAGDRPHCSGNRAARPHRHIGVDKRAPMQHHFPFFHTIHTSTSAAQNKPMEEWLWRETKADQKRGEASLPATETIAAGAPT